MSSYNNKNISEKKIKIAEFSLKLINKKGEMKIGKINDTFNSERVLIEKEANLKSFKLTEKKFNDEKIKFTGNLMSEQTSKYLLFNTKSGSNAIEIFPADDWFMFKKDINYKTINLEDAEEKMKIRSSIVENLKNKGNISNKNKKETKARKNSTEPQEKTKFVKKNFDEDEEDEDNKCFKKTKIVEEDDEKEVSDLELKEIPSDIEEDFFGKKEEKKIKLFDSNQESSFEDDDSFFEKSKENSEVEDDISEIDRKFAINPNGTNNSGNILLNF